jgi:hypothetical protein
VIHNYLWLLGLAEGEPEYDDLEKRLAEGPVITVPTITLEGDANGAPRCQFLTKKFLGKYSHRIIKGGVGHPQEARRPLPKPSSTPPQVDWAQPRNLRAPRGSGAVERSSSWRVPMTFQIRVNGEDKVIPPQLTHRRALAVDHSQAQGRGRVLYSHRL